MTTTPVTFNDDETTIPTPLPDTIAFVARVLLALPFLRSGLSKIIDFDGWSVLAVVAIALQVLGGLSVIAGYRARIGAIALIVFVIATMIASQSLFAHLVALGGLSMVAAFGSGAVSVDAKVHSGV